MKFLIIQTAFLGDVILATSLVEKLHQYFPEAQIDFMLRKGNEGVLANHPFIHETIIWEKKKNKYGNLINLIGKIRTDKYDRIINLHRFSSSGFISAFGSAKEVFGFDKNPLSFLFTKKFKHEIENGKHEIVRNHELISDITDPIPAKPKLYPSEKEYKAIHSFLIYEKEKVVKYFCIAPTSVWFTKQFPIEKWVELIGKLDQQKIIYLLGSLSDKNSCAEIKLKSNHPKIINLAGELSILESAALMRGAEMNFVNDSAPLHIASAMNAPVLSVFLSTIPEFGFGPLSDDSKVIEVKEKLDCRPCGIHGHASCPLVHFNCAWKIDVEDFIK